MNRTKRVNLIDLPALLEAPPSERSQLLLTKLSLCCTVFDFSDARKSTRDKEAKREALNEIAEYISTAATTNIWTPKIIQELLRMIQVNIFRTIYPKSRAPVVNKKEAERKTNPNGEVEEEEVHLDATWPHLQLVYEIFFRFIMSNNITSTIVDDYLSRDFMTRFVALFNSEDPREREYLKTILHKIYGKSIPLRSVIRHLINHHFCSFVYETYEFHGTAELLEILGSIINGFALPLKDENRLFLSRILLPLHSVTSIGTFHPQLTFCMMQYAAKEPATAEQIIFSLLRYWPITVSAKEVLFLNEIEEILEIIQPREFRKVLRPLFIQISKSMSSQHFQVAQRALYMWNNENIVNRVAAHRVEVLPLLFGPLYRNIETHWHNTVQTLTFNVLKLFVEMDSQLFDQCAAQYHAREERERKKLELRTKKWRYIQRDSQQFAPEAIGSNLLPIPATASSENPRSSASTPTLSSRTSTASTPPLSSRTSTASTPPLSSRRSTANSSSPLVIPKRKSGLDLT